MDVEGIQGLVINGATIKILGRAMEWNQIKNGVIRKNHTF
jgi:hypothetical protein